MNRIHIVAVALASVLSLVAASDRSSRVAAPLITQRTRTGQWLAVSRATVAQQSTRRIRVAGPWMDYIAAVVPNNGVSGRDLVKSDKQMEMTLVAVESAPRGDVNLTLIIACPTMPITNAVVAGCVTSATLPVRVFETGPIATIDPHGTVPANAQMTFRLTGERLDAATLLPRLLRLSNAAILQQGPTTMMVQGITPSCGSVDVALTDRNDGDEFPYRHASTMQRVVAGTECGRVVTPTYIQCTPPQVWDAALQACRNP